MFSHFLVFLTEDMVMELDQDKIDDVVLALLYLGLHDGARAWKSFDWDAMDRLHEKATSLTHRARPSRWFSPRKGLSEPNDCLRSCSASAPDDALQLTCLSVVPPI